MNDSPRTDPIRTRPLAVAAWSLMGRRRDGAPRPLDPVRKSYRPDRKLLGGIGNVAV
jgi:hypothetical protein